jgi:hypothetical protein
MGVVETMLERSNATYGGDETRGARRAFGQTSLKANGEDLRHAGKGAIGREAAAEARRRARGSGNGGARFDPGHGRIQMEWLWVRASQPDDWLALATEAESFVSGRG